jgi:long-chain acyl-CoA synthetase
MTAGTPVPRGRTGEIAISGGIVGPGCWLDDGATEQAFRQAGVKGAAWLSGDIRFVDDHDHLHIIDRKKGVIIYGGFNLYPIEAEDVLYKRDDVYLCALIGAPDAEKGEVPLPMSSPRPAGSQQPRR